VTLGTVVTSTGPHGGDPTARRFRFSLHSVAQLHGTSVEIFLVIAVVMLWNLARTAAPHPVIRRGQLLLGALVAQALVGYVQYLNGDPVALVAAHVAGASLVVVAVVHFHMELWLRSDLTHRLSDVRPHGLSDNRPHGLSDNRPHGLSDNRTHGVSDNRIPAAGS